MKTLLHLLDSGQLLEEYQDSMDLERSYRRFGVDGLEIIRAGEPCPLVRPETVIGYHLPFFANWMDLWMGNQSALRREFGGDQVWREFYGGDGRQALVSLFRRELGIARDLGAEYAVFHVSQVTTRENFTWDFAYTDRQVCDAAADLLNLAAEEDMGLELLLENLCWPGLTLRDPEAAARLLEQVRYPRTGLLLDTGHLMCTNLDLRSQVEACQFIHRVLDDLGGLRGRIRAVHLHQSLSGGYVRRSLERPPLLAGEFYARFAQAYSHVLKIDTHQPMTAPETVALLERVAPEYLVYEFACQGREDRERKLARQAAVFGYQKEGKSV